MNKTNEQGVKWLKKHKELNLQLVCWKKINDKVDYSEDGLNERSVRIY